MSKWIPVSERLPEEQKSYLTYWTDETMEVVDYRYEYMDLWNGKLICNQVLTHWMPLPDPPEETND
jgi:hypothetical protein